MSIYDCRFWIYDLNVYLRHFSALVFPFVRMSIFFLTALKRGKGKTNAHCHTAP